MPKKIQLISWGTYPTLPNLNEMPELFGIRYFYPSDYYIVVDAKKWLLTVVKYGIIFNSIVVYNNAEELE